jgi:hypothetical protein
VGNVITKRLLSENRDDGKQAKPGNQEKQPHRDFLTPAHNAAMIAKRGTGRKGRRACRPPSSGGVHG